VQQHELGKLLYVNNIVLYVKKYCVVQRSHNTIFFHVQQFSQFVLLDMFDSKVVWHLWATIHMVSLHSVACRPTEMGGKIHGGVLVGLTNTLSSHLSPTEIQLPEGFLAF